MGGVGWVEVCACGSKSVRVWGWKCVWGVEVCVWGVEVCVCVCVWGSMIHAATILDTVCVYVCTRCMYVKVCLNDTVIIYMQGSVYTVFVYVCVRGYNSCSITNTHSAYTQTSMA